VDTGVGGGDDGVYAFLIEPLESVVSLEVFEVRTDCAFRAKLTRLFKPGCFRINPVKPDVVDPVDEASAGFVAHPIRKCSGIGACSKEVPARARMKLNAMG
jgi:hypothetical protein